MGKRATRRTDFGRRLPWGGAPEMTYVSDEFPRGGERHRWRWTPRSGFIYSVEDAARETQGGSRG